MVVASIGLEQDQRGINRAIMRTMKETTVDQEDQVHVEREVQEYSLDHVIASWAHAVRQDGNAIEADKLMELYDKEREGMLYIAMCGHFSAGKSTVINQMCGKRLLPSSPIPTSANVVSIRYGSAHAEISYRSQQVDKPIIESIPLDRLEEVCRDGELIERVNLFEEVEWLRQGAVLLDTPGVDSTDELHREATEAALHMADIVCYVTDYNHVLSEINFAFAKQVAEAGKPLIWIVNQIDKHRETEISFAQYRSSVEMALADWGIHPAGMFFVTMLDPEHKRNEWSLVTAALTQLVEERQPIVQAGIELAARQLFLHHEAQKQKSLEQRHAAWIEELGGEEEVSSARLRLLTAEKELTRLQQRGNTVRDEFQAQLTRLLRDANISPAPLRDLAQEYLKSRSQGFKIGLIGRAAKTEAERERRLQAFEHRWQEELTANIVIHLSNLFREFAQEFGLSGDETVDAMESELPVLGKEWLAQAVQEGSVGSDEYVLNYSRTISEDAKSSIRKAMMQAVEPLIAQLASQMDNEIIRLEQQISELNVTLAQDATYRRMTMELQQAIEKQLRRMEYVYPGRDREVKPLDLMPDLSISAMKQRAARTSSLQKEEQWTASILLSSEDDIGKHLENYGQALSDSLASSAHAASGSDEVMDKQMNARAKWQLAAEQLEWTADMMKGYTSVEHMVEYMRAKAARLRNHSFSVALFGAFSAGKSSFANALMGADLLPVSPNPTTAAINRIVGSDVQHEHQTALIHMKPEDEMLEDLKYALHIMGESSVDRLTIADALKLADRWEPHMLHPAGKPHYSFLQAVKKGYAAAKPQLGQELHVSYEQYRQYVSIESRSAFVSSVDLFADNELTNQGFTFVDTPGADSINARHTGVSFEYIKNADIILFVTYYNHAFSQADRQFLTQLGRVKDSFEMDKMFFIVNAADLASSGAELDSVMEYVRARLQEFGIQSPRLYAVSSLNALEAKLTGQLDQLPRTGFSTFEREFSRFASVELTAMAIQSAAHDVARAKAQLEAMADAARADSNERAARKQQLHDSVTAATQELQSLTKWNDRKRMEQQLDELLYHVRQRMQYRMGESFVLAFNPATLRGDDKDIERSLYQCYVDWQRAFELELTNELLATSLRMEQSAKRNIREAAIERLHKARQQLTQLEYELSTPFQNWPTPQLSTATFVGEISSRKLKSIYRSSKAFFEGGGREELKLTLEKQALEHISRSGEHARDQILTHTATLTSSTLSQIAADYQAAAEQYEASLMYAFGEAADASKLLETANAIKTYMSTVR